MLQCAIIVHQGRESVLATAVGRDWKGKLSPALYLAAIPLPLSILGSRVAFTCWSPCSGLFPTAASNASMPRYGE
jgi:hypothetical protein